MKRLTLAFGGAALLVAVFVATVAAADPTPTATPPSDRGTVLTELLGLSRDEITDLRHDGLTLAEIASKQGIEVQPLIDALRARWTERIEARVANGALTDEQATALKEQVETRARDVVNRTTPGGMQGMAVGAGRGTGNGIGPRAAGPGTGTGICDGTGPHGPGRS